MLLSVILPIAILLIVICVVNIFELSPYSKKSKELQHDFKVVEAELSFDDSFQETYKQTKMYEIEKWWDEKHLSVSEFYDKYHHVKKHNDYVPLMDKSAHRAMILPHGMKIQPLPGGNSHTYWSQTQVSMPYIEGVKSFVPRSKLDFVNEMTDYSLEELIAKIDWKGNQAEQEELWELIKKKRAKLANREMLW